jgi:prepilin-type N-terminal cleavage/methylation domain-containing protein
MFEHNGGRITGKSPPTYPRGGRSSRSVPPGFTLLELLLVLALIVVLYSLASPALKRPLASQGLWKSADTIRTQWAATRVRAMRTGCIHVFQYQPGTNQYRIRPWVAPEDMVESNDASMLGAANTRQLAPSRTVRDELLQLSEGTVLVQSEVDDKRWVMMSEAQLQLNDLDPTWSSPVFFYPDGTTSTARLLLSNQYNDWAAVTLRGLTGASRAEMIDPNQEIGR